MNLGGLVIVLAGVWVSTQVIGGGALQRLRVLNSDSAPDSAPAPSGPGQPSKGDRPKGAS